MGLSIIIINHNTKALTQQTIESVLISINADNIDAEIILIDNSTKNDEKFIESITGVQLLNQLPNNGFGAACNIGASVAEKDYLLFLNSDTLLEEHTLGLAYEKITSDTMIGALGIKTVLLDGRFDHGCKRGFPTPLNSLCYFTKLDRLFPGSKLCGGYRMTYLSNDTTNEVDCVSGAFLLIKKNVFLEVGGFDEAYFMYGEDIDLCYKVKSKGYKNIYFAQTQMVHLKGQSGLHTKSPDVIHYFYKSMKIFYDKHYKTKHSLVTTFLVHLSIDLKMKLTVWKNKRNKVMQ